MIIVNKNLNNLEECLFLGPPWIDQGQLGIRARGSIFYDIFFYQMKSDFLIQYSSHWQYQEQWVNQRKCLI